jgi:hypothetical protein
LRWIFPSRHYCIRSRPLSPIDAATGKIDFSDEINTAILMIDVGARESDYLAEEPGTT